MIKNFENSANWHVHALVFQSDSRLSGHGWNSTYKASYEAGYTAKILDVLKENNVKAVFFVTAHYVNSAPELVQRMIDEGHILRESHG